MVQKNSFNMKPTKSTQPKKAVSLLNILMLSSSRPLRHQAAQHSSICGQCPCCPPLQAQDPLRFSQCFTAVPNGTSTHTLTPALLAARCVRPLTSVYERSNTWNRHCLCHDDGVVLVKPGQPSHSKLATAAIPNCSVSRAGAG